MALETVTRIADLVITNPTATDPKSEGDDHLRNIKIALKADLPNITGPITATQAELNVLDGITASTAELNLLDGVTASTAELNFVDGVTSAIQTQLDGKQPLDADLTAVAGLASAGIVARTGAGTAAARTITAGAGITVTNGDGVSGNPTIAVTALDLPNSSAVVNYTPAGTGAVTTTVQSKLREFVSVKDFGAVGDGTTDDAAAIQLAVNASVGKTLFFPVGTYIVGATINVPSDIRLAGDQGHSVIKLRSQSWGASNGLMFSLMQSVDVQFDSLVFEGNKGNVGTTRSPIFVVFDSQRITVEDCIYQNCEGICLNISTDSDDTTILRCKFISCGGNPNNSDGYRKQAIAFSSNLVDRAKNVVIKGCYFYQQGLDCISLADCDNVQIADNVAVDGYSLLYSNPTPYTVTNLAVTGNVVRVCSEFGAATAVPPLAMDLPAVDGLVVSGNSLYDIDASGIGLFDGTKNAVISGNTIVNPMRYNGAAFVSGIVIGSGVGTAALNNIVIEGNLIVDTAGSPLMDYGIVVKSDATNVFIQDNVIRNPSVSRYGYFATDPIDVNIAAFSVSTQIASSSRIVDIDVANNLETIHGRSYVQASHADPAVRITQLGSGFALVVEDEATPDATFFGVSADGNVGIRINPLVFGGPLTVSGTGADNRSILQAIGNDAFGAALCGYKTRNASPYGSTSVQIDDVLLRLEARGNDGSDYRQAAVIQCAVDGAPSGISMPGRIEFFTTPAGSLTPVLRAYVRETGAVRYVPQTTPSSPLAGDVYYDSGTNKLRCYNGTIWNDLF